MITKKTLTKILTIATLAAAIATFCATTVFADTPDLSNDTFNVNEILDLDKNDVGGTQEQDYFAEEVDKPIIAFIIDVIDFATKIIGSVAFLMMILAGLMMVVSQGDQQKLDSAKEMFKYTIIGLLIAFMSYIIIIFVQSIFLPQEVKGGSDETTAIVIEIA